jgi:REP element-mobilizing transposase RayT
MARKPRIHIPGGLYHVMLRGNGGREIFLLPDDGRHFLDLLAEGVARFGFRVHGYCLMPNHVHLVLQAGALPLSRAMQMLSFRYTRRINTREARAGHLFQGRYKAILVDAESYLLELVRYVHLNPVRAGLAAAPEAWRWSGHRGYLGQADTPWLTTDWLLEQLAPGLDAARAAYRDFVADGVGGSRRAEFHSGSGADGRVLGGDDFIERALAEAGEKPERPPEIAAILDAVARDRGVAVAELAGPSRAWRFSEARGIAGFIARESGAASLTALAARFERDQSSLSRSVRKVEKRAIRDKEFAARLRNLNNATTHA